MFRTATLLCVMSLTAIGTVQAADAIAVEKLTRAQLQEALKSASDDTVIDFEIQKLCTTGTTENVTYVIDGHL